MVCCTTGVCEYFAIENATKQSHQSHTVITTHDWPPKAPTNHTFWHITPFVAFCCHNDTTRASPAHRHGTSGTVCCYQPHTSSLPSIVDVEALEPSTASCSRIASVTISRVSVTFLSQQTCYKRTHQRHLFSILHQQHHLSRLAPAVADGLQQQNVLLIELSLLGGLLALPVWTLFEARRSVRLCYSVKSLITF